MNLIGKPSKPLFGLPRLNLPSITIAVPRRVWASAGGAAGALVILLHLYPMWQIGRRTQHLDAFQTTFSQFGAQQAEVAQVQEAIQQLQQVQALLQQGKTGGRVHWAPLLAGLSESMIDGVWLTELTGRVGGSPDSGGPVDQLEITGTVLTSSEDATKRIGQFLRALQTHPLFLRHVDRVELLETTRRKIQSDDVMDFTIRCHLVSPQS